MSVQVSSSKFSETRLIGSWHYLDLTMQLIKLRILLKKSFAASLQTSPAAKATWYFQLLYTFFKYNYKSTLHNCVLTDNYETTLLYKPCYEWTLGTLQLTCTVTLHCIGSVTSLNKHTHSGCHFANISSNTRFTHSSSSLPLICIVYR